MKKSHLLIATALLALVGLGLWFFNADKPVDEPTLANTGATTKNDSQQKSDSSKVSLPSGDEEDAGTPEPDQEDESDEAAFRYTFTFRVNVLLDGKPYFDAEAVLAKIKAEVPFWGIDDDMVPFSLAKQSPIRRDGDSFTMTGRAASLFGDKAEVETIIDIQGCKGEYFTDASKMKRFYFNPDSHPKLTKSLRPKARSLSIDFGEFSFEMRNMVSRFYRIEGRILHRDGTPFYGESYIHGGRGNRDIEPELDAEGKFRYLYTNSSTDEKWDPDDDMFGVIGENGELLENPRWALSWSSHWLLPDQDVIAFVEAEDDHGPSYDFDATLPKLVLRKVGANLYQFDDIIIDSPLLKLELNFDLGKDFVWASDVKKGAKETRTILNDSAESSHAFVTIMQRQEETLETTGTLSAEDAWVGGEYIDGQPWSGSLKEGVSTALFFNDEDLRFATFALISGMKEDEHYGFVMEAMFLSSTGKEVRELKITLTPAPTFEAEIVKQSGGAFDGYAYASPLIRDNADDQAKRLWMHDSESGSGRLRITFLAMPTGEALIEVSAKGEESAIVRATMTSFPSRIVLGSDVRPEEEPTEEPAATYPEQPLGLTIESVNVSDSMRLSLLLDWRDKSDPKAAWSNSPLSIGLRLSDGDTSCQAWLSLPHEVKDLECRLRFRTLNDAKSFGFNDLVLVASIPCEFDDSSWKATVNADIKGKLPAERLLKENPFVFEVDGKEQWVTPGLGFEHYRRTNTLASSPYDEDLAALFINNQGLSKQERQARKLVLPPNVWIDTRSLSGMEIWLSIDSNHQEFRNYRSFKAGAITKFFVPPGDATIYFSSYDDSDNDLQVLDALRVPNAGHVLWTPPKKSGKIEVLSQHIAHRFECSFASSLSGPRVQIEDSFDSDDTNFAPGKWFVFLEHYGHVLATKSVTVIAGKTTIADFRELDQSKTFGGEVRIEFRDFARADELPPVLAKVFYQGDRKFRYADDYEAVWISDGLVIRGLPTGREMDIQVEIDPYGAMRIFRVYGVNLQAEEQKLIRTKSPPLAMSFGVRETIGPRPWRLQERNHFEVIAQEESGEELPREEYDDCVVEVGKRYRWVLRAYGVSRREACPDLVIPFMAGATDTSAQSRVKAAAWFKKLEAVIYD